jgi:PQQ-dependent catabolism-associated beta-propeller protein
MSGNGLVQRALKRPSTWLVVAVALIFAAPVSPAMAAGTGYVFVSNERTHNVLVFDPANDYALVKDIPTSRRPRDMKFNNAHTLLYVACGDDDVIEIIDVATLEVVDYIPTGRSPERFVFNRAETLLFVSNEENSTLQVIDLELRIIVHEVPTGAEPEGVILSEDERTIYVTSEIADMVHVIDAETGAVVDNIIVGTRPRRFVLTPDGAELWVSDELSGTVTIIDRATNTVIEQIHFLPPGFRPVDVTPVGMTINAAGDTIYVGLGRANHVAYVDVATHEIGGYTLVGSRAWDVILSPDESLLYVANGLSDDMSIIEVSSRRNIRTISTGRIPYTVLIDG